MGTLKVEARDLRSRVLLRSNTEDKVVPPLWQSVFLRLAGLAPLLRSNIEDKVGTTSTAISILFSFCEVNRPGPPLIGDVSFFVTLQQFMNRLYIFVYRKYKSIEEALTAAFSTTRCCSLGNEGPQKHVTQDIGRDTKYGDYPSTKVSAGC